MVQQTMLGATRLLVEAFGIGRLLAKTAAKSARQANV
jgi:hypothetical protein